MNTKRHAPLDMDAAEFRSIGHQLVDRVADLLGTLSQRPITPGETPTQVRHALDSTQPMPNMGCNAAELIAHATDLLFDHSLFNSHPRFMGYVTTPPAPIGILGEFLAAAVNANTGAWFLAPMATEIEAQTIRWIAELLDFPSGCGGLLVSGGNMANMVGLWAARQAKAGWDARAAGLHGDKMQRLRLYCSKETHTWVYKAADLAGIGTDGVRWIPTDKELRMDVDALRKHIRADRAAGDQPFFVAGTAGSVSTGAIDPLGEIAELCRDEELWFHVDGAYGGFAAMLPDAPADLRSLREADSVAIDPHKWLYAPLEAGCVLVRDPENLRAAFAYHPPYYQFGVEAINYFDLGPQNSRGFRALKVWLALQQVGRTGYEQMLTDDIDLSKELHALIEQQTELEAYTQSLSITTFRYVPPDLDVGSDKAETYLNQLNTELLARLQQGGEAYVSNAVLDGKFLLRACIVNFRTSLADIQMLPNLVIKIGREVDAALRPEAHEAHILPLQPTSATA
jgi:aromatic-L-amino-acid/L-tryptophan decarboxylase